MKRLFALLAALAATLAQAQMMTMPLTPSYEGLWWKSPAGSESGWGLNITHQGNVLFATWFTYDADGTGMWLVMPDGELMPGSMGMYGYGYGDMDQPIVYTGTLYRTTGPAFDAATFDSSAVHATPVGSAMLRFSTPDDGVFTYTVNGVTQDKPITRQVFSTMPDCGFGMPGTTPNYQDLWWRSPAGSESGWGVNVTHQGDILFATWFTYDASGRGLWLVMPAGMRTGANTYSGALYRTTGPAFNAAPWDSTRVVATPVGNATFSFIDHDSGMFTTTVSGETQSKPITRQVYATPMSVCQ